MTNLISNINFDKAFQGERINCTQPLKEKRFEKDVKQIFRYEKVIDYRCYLSKINQIIYYMVETKDKYIAFKQNLKTKEIEAYESKKG